jgi:hypothetical protein
LLYFIAELFDLDCSYSIRFQSDHTGCGFGQIEDALLAEGTSIGDGDFNLFHGAQEGHTNPTAQGNGSTCSGQRTTVKPMSICHTLALVFLAVPAGLAADYPRRQADWSKQDKSQQ